jgi:hypothetical protein
LTTPTHTDALLATIEQRADVINAPLLEVLERVRRRLVALSLDPTKLQGPAVAAIVDEVLAEMAVAARRAVRAGSDKDRVTEELDYRQRRTQLLARDLQTTERPSLAKALLMLRAAESLASGLKGIVSDQEVTRQTEAVRGKLRPGNVLMWVPERDACVRCTRYAGLRLLRPGDRFPGGLSYDPEQDTTDVPSVKGPPLHPHCRCELQQVRKGGSEDASAALRREADRSVLKGWARESESNAARRRAAEKLLASGVRAPASVKAEARRRLRGDGPFVREVPDGA